MTSDTELFEASPFSLLTKRGLDLFLAAVNRLPSFDSYHTWTNELGGYLILLRYYLCGRLRSRKLLDPLCAKFASIPASCCKHLCAMKNV